MHRCRNGFRRARRLTYTQWEAALLVSHLENAVALRIVFPHLSEVRVREAPEKGWGVGGHLRGGLEVSPVWYGVI